MAARGVAALRVPRHIRQGRLAAASIAVLLSALSLRADDRPLPIHTVLIDATAFDARGRAVTNLGIADFEVRQDGHVETLDRADYRHDSTPRLVAIYLDEYHLSATAANDGTRAALTRFVDQILAPTDRVVVMKPLDSLFAIKLSEDRTAAHAAIENFEGRLGDYEPKNNYERNFIAGTPARIDAARDQVALSAINALAVHLGSLGEGRKTLIVVTERIGRSDRRRGQEFLPTLDTIVRSANRANVSVYPVDPRNLGPAADVADELRRLANDTNGAVVSGDIDGGLERAARDAAGYYLLAYRAAHLEDGRFHDVEVISKRSGIRIHARRGYWAPSPDDALRAEVLDRLNNPKPPPPLEPARHISPLIRPWFGLSRGENGNTRVTMVWEPAARVPGDRTRHTVSRVVVKALAGDDSVLFDGPVKPTGPGATESGGSVPTRAVFDAPPGSLRLRMTIQDAAEERLDGDVRDISIPDFTRRVAIGTPEIMRARNAREFRELADADAVPVASRDFSRTERLLIRFVAYSPDDASSTMTARLLNRAGQTIRDLPIQRSTERGGVNTIDLTLAAFAAGDYAVEIGVAAAGMDAKERVPFRVTW